MFICYCLGNPIQYHNIGNASQIKKYQINLTWVGWGVVSENRFSDFVNHFTGFITSVQENVI